MSENDNPESIETTFSRAARSARAATRLSRDGLQSDSLNAMLAGVADQAREPQRVMPAGVRNAHQPGAQPFKPPSAAFERAAPELEATSILATTDRRTAFASLFESARRRQQRINEAVRAATFAVMRHSSDIESGLRERHRRLVNLGTGFLQELTDRRRTAVERAFRHRWPVAVAGLVLSTSAVLLARYASAPADVEVDPAAAVVATNKGGVVGPSPSRVHSSTQAELTTSGSQAVLPPFQPDGAGLAASQAVAEVAASPPRTPVRLFAEQSDAGNAGQAESFASRPQALAAAGADIDITWTTSWSATLAALTAQPSAAVVRYDALQAARDGRGADIPPLQIVAPLAVEPIYAVVRADSALQYLHELEGRSINIGAVGGGRALTVDTLYRTLFAKPMVSHPFLRTEATPALEAVGRGELDVVVFVGSAPTSLFATPHATHRQVAYRLLRFDPRHPRAASMLRNFLPVHLNSGALSTQPAHSISTLGVMSFIVTATTRDPQQTAGRDVWMRGLAIQLCGTAARDREAGSLRVDPALELDVGWSYSPVARKALSGCSVTGPAATLGRQNARLTPGTS